MNVNWINIHEIPDLKDKKIVLFGAGEGSREFVSWLKRISDSASIRFIVDNDVSIHGKCYYGYDVIHPKHLHDLSFDMVIVTSISGRDDISDQLVGMGYEQGKDFFLIGTYPVSFHPAIHLIKKYYFNTTPVREKNSCLTIGPGGSLSLEILLYCYGFDHVVSVDKYRFGIDYPNISEDSNTVQMVKKCIETERDDHIKATMMGRFDSLFNHGKTGWVLDETKIQFHCPMDACDLSFEDNTFDFIFSSGVLEHVVSPESGVSEIMRVLKQGGIALNKVVTRDHRSFSPSSDYHPFSFRSYSRKEWHDISSRKFYQNRILPIQWKRLFETHGLTVDRFDVEERMAIDDQMMEGFHPDFHRFPRAELEAVNCVISGCRS